MGTSESRVEEWSLPSREDGGNQEDKKQHSVVNSSGTADPCDVSVTPGLGLSLLPPGTQLGTLISGPLTCVQTAPVQTWCPSESALGPPVVIFCPLLGVQGLSHPLVL